ncbi:OmpA family protein [Azospirillum rugosum]|uniref:Outer membrane protein OmpA-like peptidoglycan-associated protein n=1 Tax=Azospirillum rugosum TaxID=416170 RepID=A0ABS4SSR0_9PROT|nr:OmpA family protein [Azospirillum rugosum]MBP2295592.1 outer membrane protein OmpA-like peptidoglycan-associated protein [Azospirillum rugosum]MDQ0529518.1 outer membrane protein OmpA-like peptidoglycan-associated protein [Azospirillum rugosum]
MGTALLLAAMAISVPMAVPMAQTAMVQTVPLGPNPSECEIQAALLGAAGSGCPPVAMKRPPPEPAAPAPPVQAPEAVALPAVPGPVALPAALPAVGLKAAFRINFDFNSARIRPESRAVLDRVAAVMAEPAAAAARFRIVGHTDAVGTDKANLTLSQRRAAAVVDYLAEIRGIHRDRLESGGMGSREPLIPANPKAAENRRVEIVNLGG